MPKNIVIPTERRNRIINRKWIIENDKIEVREVKESKNKGSIKDIFTRLPDYYTKAITPLTT